MKSTEYFLIANFTLIKFWQFGENIFSNDISTELEILPRYSTSFIGDSVVFRCVDVSVPKRSIYWMHRPVGKSTDSYIFSGWSGILDYYKVEGRHAVTFDDSARTSQLVIKNISLEDAGTYALSTDPGDLSQADLVVISESS